MNIVWVLWYSSVLFQMAKKLLFFQLVPEIYTYRNKSITRLFFAKILIDAHLPRNMCTEKYLRKIYFDEAALMMFIYLIVYRDLNMISSKVDCWQCK